MTKGDKEMKENEYETSLLSLPVVVTTATLFTGKHSAQLGSVEVIGLAYLRFSLFVELRPGLQGISNCEIYLLVR